MVEDVIRDGGMVAKAGSTRTITTDRNLIRLSALLLVIGIILSLGVGLLHPGREAPNDHMAVFAEYASSTLWTAVHLGQFVGDVVVIAGVLVLSAIFYGYPGMAGLTGLFTTISAGVTLTLYGVLQAVDGVALKRAVDAWVRAPEAEKAARFASAEAIRWLEEAIRGYQDWMLGLTFILLALLIVWKAKIPRPIGYLFGLSGLSYLAQGWVLDMEGFSPTHGLTQLPAYLFMFAAVIWLAIAAWRMKEPPHVPVQ